MQYSEIQERMRHPEANTAADNADILNWLQASAETLKAKERKEVLSYLRGNLPNTAENNRALSTLYVIPIRKRVLPEETLNQLEQTAETRQQYVNEQRKKRPKAVRAAKRKLWFFRLSHLRKLPHLDAQTISELLYYKLVYNMDYSGWYSYGFQDKSVQERRAYIQERERILYGLSVNGYIAMEFLGDKYRTYSKLQPYYQREIISIAGPSDYRKYCEFVDRHPQYIRKISNFGAGIGLKKVNLKSPFLRKARATALFGYYMLYINVIQRLVSFLMSKLEGHRMKKCELVLEELIVQHPSMAKLNDSSVNTVRTVVFKTKTDGVHVGLTVVRMGRHGAAMDNAHSGGIFAEVDPKTGVVTSDAFDDMGQRYERHPDSGVKLKGLQLPAWDELVALAKKISSELENINYVGWDLSYTDHGWVVVEGNSMASMDVHQTLAGRGLRDFYYGKKDDMDVLFA